jgi:hypothetical protein
MLDSGEQMRNKQRQFFFERQWTKMEGFQDTIKEKWQMIRNRSPNNAYSLDVWHGGLAALRQILKGWGANLRGEYKRKKKSILEKIQDIDRRGEGSESAEEVIKERHHLEGDLEKAMEEEETYWQQRGGGKWILEGGQQHRNIPPDS